MRDPCVCCPFLSQDGVVKIGDFGISKRLNNTNELAKTAIGTPYYLSPEICREKRYNYKSDVWSLGCVLYEMAAQKHAFQGSDMRQLVLRILRGSYPPISRSYTKPLHDLIAELLACDPKRRPSVNAILAKPLVKSRIARLMANAVCDSRCPPSRPGLCACCAVLCCAGWEYVGATRCVARCDS